MEPTAELDARCGQEKSLFPQRGNELRFLGRVARNLFVIVTYLSHVESQFSAYSSFMTYFTPL
jgi:hypothetical protein